MVRIWVNIALNGPKLCTHSKFSPIRGNDSMFDLAYYNPKLSGNVYKGIRKCGKTDCKCATSPKNKHSFYRLEYRVKEKGRWVRKREYVPKCKVNALRQRIRRAKQKDRQRRQQIKQFMQKATEFINSDDHIDTAKLKHLLSLSRQTLEPATLRQRTQLLKCLVELVVELAP